MSDTKLKTSSETSKIPSSITAAQDIINGNPDLFPNNTATLLAIASGLCDYALECTEYLHRPVDPLSDVKKITTTLLSKQDYSLNEPDFESIHSPEESIMDRGCHGQF